MLGVSHDTDVWQDTLSAAWNAGIRLYDTSPFYGFGNAEIRAGRFLAKHDPSEFVVGTKVGRLLRLNADTEYFAAMAFYPELGGRMPDNVPRCQVRLHLRRHASVCAGDDLAPRT